MFFCVESFKTFNKGFVARGGVAKKRPFKENQTIICGKFSFFFSLKNNVHNWLVGLTSKA